MTLPIFHVFLSHGLESGPRSTKIQAMKAVAEEYPGVVAEAVDHRSSKDPTTRLKQMQAAMERVGAAPSVPFWQGPAWAAGCVRKQAP